MVSGRVRLPPVAHLNGGYPRQRWLNTMTTKSSHNYQQLIDTDGIELWVLFDYEVDRNVEECHGYHVINDTTIKIIDVDLVINGRSINVVKQLKQPQLDHLASLISL